MVQVGGGDCGWGGFQVTIVSNLLSELHWLGYVRLGWGYTG